MKKICFLIFIGLFLANFSPFKALSQGSITQPTPQIIHPQAGSTLLGTIVIEIYIEPTVVYLMEVYALADNSSRLFLGNAEPQGGTYYIKYWNTKSVANGNYQLWAQAKIDGGQLTTYSAKVPVIVKNTTVSPPRTPTPKPTPAPSPTPTPQETTTPEQGTATTDEGETTQNQTTDKGVPIIAATPKTEIPLATPSPTVPLEKNLLLDSRLIKTLEFKTLQDKETRLEKIENRLTPAEQGFLYFIGKTYPEANLKLTINSQPLVMTIQADNKGAWTYTLEKPLEPGRHEVYLEVTKDNLVETNGPYPFTIAKAQASPDNPTGASLALADSSSQVIKNYLYLVAGVIGLALIILLIIYLFRKQKNRRPKEAVNV